MFVYEDSGNDIGTDAKKMKYWWGLGQNQKVIFRQRKYLMKHSTLD